MCIAQVAYWFQHTLGYSYNVEEQGLPADWLLDLVSIGFHNSLHSYGFQTVTQLEEASNKFINEKLDLAACNGSASMKESMMESGSPSMLPALYKGPWSNLYCLKPINILASPKISMTIMSDPPR